MSTPSAIRDEAWYRTCLVTTPGDLEAVFRLRHKVYCHECNFIDPSSLPDGLETDHFDSRSVHFAAFDVNGTVAAAARLVLPGHSRGYPYQEHCPAVDAATLPPATTTAEVSRLVLNRDHRQPPGGGPLGSVVLGVYREMYQYSVQNDITHWYAAMERKLHRLLSRYGFHFDAIGPQTGVFGHRSIYAAEVSALLAGLGVRNPAMHRWFADLDDDTEHLPLRVASGR